MDNHERRIRHQAQLIWEQAGRPKDGPDAFMDKARELIALEDQQGVATVPLAESLGPSAEPIEALVNEGEFPTLTDQGEQQIPARRRDQRA
jgi:hypothetical protein